MSQEAQPGKDILGIVIVSYKAGSLLLDCLNSLLDNRSAQVRIVICDNASSDDTCALVTEWARDSLPDNSDGNASFIDLDAEFIASKDTASIPFVTLIRSTVNRGFAGGVNMGLAYFQQFNQVKLYWVLNPDCRVPRTSIDVALRYFDHDPNVGLIGGRILYEEKPNLIQSDAGQINRLTGVCRNVHRGKDPNTTMYNSQQKADFISGASMLVTRDFLESVGPMEEDYFLYYEEVDWAIRRKTFSISLCEDLLVYHVGGASIGTGSLTRRASQVANYFNYRNRMRYMARFHPLALPISFLYSVAAICKGSLKGGWKELYSSTLGLLQLPAPPAVHRALGNNAFTPPDRQDLQQ